MLAYHHPLVQSLFDYMQSSKSGAFVHWGVYESGKTTAARQAAWRLQEEAGKQVILLQSYNIQWNRQGENWLRRAIRVPDDNPMADFFTQDTTIIINHFDMFMCDKDKHSEETLEWVNKFIEESERTKKFNVLLLVTSWERAQELVDAGCKLVPGDSPARWTRDELETLYASLSDKGRSIMNEKEDELLRLATLSGTPGFLNFSAHGERISPKQPAMHDLEWRRGMKWLYQQTQLDLAPHVEIGRFPDRSGVYHHEDFFWGGGWPR